MLIRKRCLPAGWYPSTADGVRTRIAEMLEILPDPGDLTGGISAIVPHAGWEFSGSVAVDTLRRLKRNMTTAVVIGGHLSSNTGIHAALEEGYDTPLGIIETDLELLEALKERIDIVEDVSADNTVEVQLPLLKYLFPEIKALSLRAPPSSVSLELGRLLRRLADSLTKEILVIGSTDLTHYGQAYNFAPRGSGDSAVKWVKETNDKRIVEAFLALDEHSLELAQTEHSACSAGGAASAIAFAAASGARRSGLITYTTSWDILPSSSFVGYAGILYRR